MRAQREKGGTADPAPGAEQNWLGNSLWQAPEVEISRIKSWASITAVSYRRAGGESVWRGDRHRIILTRDHIPPMLLQVEQGPTWQKPAAAPGALSFYPAGLTVRGVVKPGGRLIQVLWDTDVYSALLPELGAEASRFEFLVLLQDPLLAQIVFTLAQEVESGFADRILVEVLARPCVSASLGALLGISRYRPARAFRRDGCSACAITSRRISMKTSR